MKEIYELVEIELVRLQAMDAIASSVDDGGLEEDELPGFGIKNNY